MIRRRSVLRTLGVGGALTVSGCLGRSASSPEGNNAGTQRVTDGFGRTVSVPRAVERVVAIGPGALRQIAYLDATDRVVGVEDAQKGWATRIPYNLANPKLRDNPVIGSAGPNAGGNSEQILAVDPDVICYYGESSRAETLQSQTDTPVLGLEIVDITDSNARQTMFDTWQLLGNVLETESRAAALVEFVRETIADLDARTDGITADDRKRAYVGAINYAGSHGIVTTRKRFSPFRWTGIENVASGVETDAASVQVSVEQLLAWDPDTMFASASNLGRVRDDVRSNAEYESLRAVETGETYSILPHASYHHNYGSILANAYFVGKTVYPDRFGDVDIKTKTNEIYESMLGATLYADLTAECDAFQRLDLP